MARESIERAVQGPESDNGVSYFTIRYEGYGPGGVAVMVDCVTDNGDRTVDDLRRTFTSCGGILGASGSVAYLFNQVGLMTYPAGTSVDRLMEVGPRRPGRKTCWPIPMARSRC